MGSMWQTRRGADHDKSRSFFNDRPSRLKKVAEKERKKKRKQGVNAVYTEGRF